MTQNTKLIPLTQGHSAIVDAADYDDINQFRWFSNSGDGLVYARRHVRLDVNKRGSELMHRRIIRAPTGMQVDHIDGNGLNNTRANLRLCIQSENQSNRRPNAGSSSVYRGVSWYKPGGVWRASVNSNGVHYYLGQFSTEIEAAMAWNAKASELYGEFARLNEVI